MTERDESIYLRHILESIERIETYLDGVSEEEFQSDPLLQDGVVRRLEIIGEATKRLSDGIRDRQSDVPWRDIAGMRDKLVHEYFGGDLVTVWETAREDIPALKQAVVTILGGAGSN